MSPVGFAPAAGQKARPTRLAFFSRAFCASGVPRRLRDRRRRCGVAYSKRGRARRALRRTAIDCLCRLLAERGPVFLNGGGELTILRKCGAQVRTNFRCVGIGPEELAVAADRGCGIAGTESRLSFPEAVLGCGRREHCGEREDERSNPALGIITWRRYTSTVKADSFLSTDR